MNLSKLKYLVLLMFWSFSLQAQNSMINGKVYDNISKSPIEKALVRNLYTGELVIADSLGQFQIHAKDDELIIFEAVGYEVAKVRMKSYFMESYFNIGVSKPLEEPVLDSVPHDFYNDSLALARYFAKELSFKKMTPAEIANNPWELMSKTNKQKWKLQETFKQYISDRYVDENFSEKLLTEISPLRGELLQQFMKYYRPSYSFIRSLTKYEYTMWLIANADRFYQMNEKKDVQNQ